MTTAPAPLVVSGLSGSSPLPSPSFSLAPQRSTSLRMGGPSASPSSAAAATAHTAPTSDHHHHAAPKHSYSLRGGRAGPPGFGPTPERRFEDREREFERPSERAHDRPDRSERVERAERPERSERGRGFGDHRAEHFSRGPPRDFPSKSSYRGRDERPLGGGGGASSVDREREREREKKLTPSQVYANSLPVSGLLEAPPSPTLPPSFHTPEVDAAAAATSQPVPTNVYAVLDDADGDGESALDGDNLPFESFPLLHQWTVFFDRKVAAGKGKQAAVPPKQGVSAHADQLSSFESNLHTIGQFASVHEFWQLMGHIQPASALEQNSTLHVFKQGIKPVWEDPANRAGGKFIFRIAAKDKGLLDHCWQNILLACIGGTLDADSDEVCGVVLSRRRMGDRIAVWNRHREDSPDLVALGHRFRAALLEGLEPDHGLSITLSYEDNEETIRVGYCAMGSNVRFTL